MDNVRLGRVPHVDPELVKTVEDIRAGRQGEHDYGFSKYIMDDEQLGRELPQEPFLAVISLFNKKLIDIIKDREPTEEEIQLLLIELESVAEQLEQIINELTQNYEQSRQNRYTGQSDRHVYNTRKYRLKYKSYTEQLHFYIPYYAKIINNFKDVVIFTNQNACLFQVGVKDINKLATIKNYTYRYIKLMYIMVLRGEQINPDEFDVIDVYDTDDKYYYGICNGKIICTPIDNTVRLALNSGVCFPLHYLAITDHFMKQLFTTDLSTANPNIPHKLLLFEHGSAKFIKKFKFSRFNYEYSGSDSDSDFDDGGLLQRSISWVSQSLDENTFYLYSLFDLFLSKSKNYAEIFNTIHWYPFENNYIWNIFFNLLTSNNKLHRTCALQNFKYFFIKNDIELNNLHKDINRYITTNTQFTNMKLIDFFIPEIKLLLHRILYDKLEVRLHDNLQREWDAYVIEYNKPPNTRPQTFLNYLLNVVLEKLVHRDRYKCLLTTLSGMFESLITEMAKNKGLDGPNYKFISDIIDRLVRKQFKLKQLAGKLVSKKKNGQKKISRKK